MVRSWRWVGKFIYEKEKVGGVNQQKILLVVYNLTSF